MKMMSDMPAGMMERMSAEECAKQAMMETAKNHMTPEMAAAQQAQHAAMMAEQKAK